MLEPDAALLPTHRVVLPVLVSAWVMLTLAVVNGELVIPHIAGPLSYEKSDPEGEKEPVGFQVGMHSARGSIRACRRTPSAQTCT